MKPLIWLISLLAAGWSFPKLLVSDAARRRNFLKLGTPAVDESYARVLAPGRTYHDLKNVLVEWTRADPQLAAKCLAFVALTGWLAAVFLAWWVLG